MWRLLATACAVALALLAQQAGSLDQINTGNASALKLDWTFTTGLVRGHEAAPLVARRMYVAGVLENNPKNIERWIVNPKAVDDQTAMPALGVTSADACDIAAYLYTLR